MTTTLVLGASGNIGAELVRNLTALGHTVRSATSKPAARPGEVTLDLVTGTGLSQAFAGAGQAFLLAPSGHARQDSLLVPAIDAARAAGLRKVVLLSAMGANADDNAPLRRAELHLQRSGLAWNVIRPNWFMQNFHTFWLSGIKAQGQIFLPTGRARGSFIDTRDIAAVTARLLSTDSFANADFDLTGARALDHDEVAAILSRVAGRTIGYTDISPDSMLEGLLGAGVPRDYAEFLIVILGAFKAGYNERVTDEVRRITGRDPIAFEQYASDHRAAWA
jgi:uncharacterized protein YbjT (DUF2867 family)